MKMFIAVGLVLAAIIGGAALIIGRPTPAPVQPAATQPAAPQAAAPAPEPVEPPVVAPAAIVASRSAPVADAADGSFLTDFTGEFDKSGWYFADFAMPKDHVSLVAWNPDRIRFDDSGMTLSLVRKRDKGREYSAAEVQRRKPTHYGRYEVVMRPSLGSGQSSNFFVFSLDPHDELDIEFTGNRPAHIEFNTFRKGRPKGGVRMRLPFDATKAFQLYAFEWDRDEVRWYVGEQLVYSVTSDDVPIPVTPGKVIMNIWTGVDAMAEWLGPRTFESGVSAQYLCASHRAEGGVFPQCSDRFRFDHPPLAD